MMQNQQPSGQFPDQFQRFGRRQSAVPRQQRRQVFRNIWTGLVQIVRRLHRVVETFLFGSGMKNLDQMGLTGGGPDITSDSVQFPPGIAERHDLQCHAPPQGVFRQIHHAHTAGPAQRVDPAAGKRIAGTQQQHVGFSFPSEFDSG